MINNMEFQDLKKSELLNIIGGGFISEFKRGFNSIISIFFNDYNNPNY